MKNDFIYDLMRSKEIREYYRKNVELDVEEQECIIINSYNPLKEKIRLLKKLLDNIPEENKKDIKEMITLYELVYTIFYNPYEFFGNDYRVIYALHYLKPLCNLLGNEIAISKCRLDGYYSEIVEYFDTIEKMIEFMDVDNCKNCNEPFEVDIIVVPNNRNPLCFLIDFYCEYIDEKFEPINFILDKKSNIFDKYNISDTISRKSSLRVCNKGLPFEDGCRIKIQTPIMKEPFYGIISSKQDYPIDPNSCWYNFVYKDDTKKEEFDKSPILFNLSYNNINIASEHSVYDWVNRA